ncbi:hypothetical protein FGO68_gene13364 [Halteria grandinella]|uniref:Uncharacterized protein n=1 Tax=Halteria grandinella TaxID=5974 RepID=A0A8J8NAQ0_HALGN|nr:hypothetical protein FGO68_gene13364 [Halteria grandinella]
MMVSSYAGNSVSRIFENSSYAPSIDSTLDSHSIRKAFILQTNAIRYSPHGDRYSYYNQLFDYFQLQLIYILLTVFDDRIHRCQPRSSYSSQASQQRISSDKIYVQDLVKGCSLKPQLWHKGPNDSGLEIIFDATDSKKGQRYRPTLTLPEKPRTQAGTSRDVRTREQRKGRRRRLSGMQESATPNLRSSNPCDPLKSN